MLAKGAVEDGAAHQGMEAKKHGDILPAYVGILFYFLVVVPPSPLAP